MMAQAKRNYVLIIKVNKLFPRFSLLCFLEDIENMFSVFLSSYGNAHESLRELKKLWKHWPAACDFHSIFHSPKLPLVFL